jgi:dihydroorotate dehydrogenase
LDAIGRETGLGKRVAPVISACLLALIDAEEQLGLAPERAEEIVREAVEERWGDFSQDIVAAHRRAMDRTRQALANAETVIPLRPLERTAHAAPPEGRPAPRADLRTRYLGFSLRTPLIACVAAEASEAQRRAVAESPAGAVFFGPVSEEDLDREAWRTFETLHQGVRGPNQKTRPPLERYAELLKEWKEAVEVPVIAGIAASTEKNWLALAFALEQAGADALEILLRSPEEGGPADPLRIISLVSAAVRVPVAARITPELAILADRLEDAANAGAKALVLFHPPSAFLKHPDTLEQRRENLLAGPEVFRLALPKLARISFAPPPLDLGAAGPVSTTGDLLRALLAGSHAVYVASDPDTASRLETSLKDWMGAKGFAYLPLSDGEVRRSVVD